MTPSRELTPEERTAIEALRDLPDDAIDTSDMPEVLDWSRAVRGAIQPRRRRAEPTGE